MHHILKGKEVAFSLSSRFVRLIMMPLELKELLFNQNPTFTPRKRRVVFLLTPFTYKKSSISSYHHSKIMGEISTFLGRVTRFELVNDRFTAGCVWPLHHTRHALVILSI